MKLQVLCVFHEQSYSLSNILIEFQTQDNLPLPLLHYMWHVSDAKWISVSTCNACHIVRCNAMQWQCKLWLNSRQRYFRVEICVCSMVFDVRRQKPRQITTLMFMRYDYAFFRSHPSHPTQNAQDLFPQAIQILALTLCVFLSLVCFHFSLFFFIVQSLCYAHTDISIHFSSETQQ